MPAVFLDRLPLPSLQAYTTISVSLLLCSVYYAVKVTSELEWRLEGSDQIYVGNITKPSLKEIVYEMILVKRLRNATYFMLQEPFCIWTLINMAYCSLALMGKFIQKLVFGELRVSEQQHIKDKFWNFVFYKFIFIFGVMNVQFIEEILLWCSWFSVLGFLHLLAQLCKDRFEYLSFSPTTPKGTHVRLLVLLFTILTLAFSLVGICICVGFHIGLNTFAFMAAECLLVTLRTLYVVVRYGIHLWDINQDGVWEKRSSYAYYTELIFEMTALNLDFLHHFHMLLWGNIFLSMASLVILMQLRYLFYEIRHRLRKYRNYLRIVRHMETTYPLASSEELQKNSDDCAICWDHMDFARKLPCSHLFHNSCLRSWLEQDTSCPTCRKSLTETDPSPKMTNSSDELDVNDYSQESINQASSHFFHFGLRYMGWWPRFSVEVSQTSLPHNRESPENRNAHVDNMARQVQRMFPNFPLSQIINDLNVTRSLETTVENILDGKIVLPFPMVKPASQTKSEDTSAHESDTEDDVQLTSNTAVKQEVMTAAGSSMTYLEDTVLPLSESEEEHEEKEKLVPFSSGLGCRFSKSPKERETILSRRKKEMIELAQRKYLKKLATDNSISEKAALSRLEQKINSRRSSRNMLHSLFLRIREM